MLARVGIRVRLNVLTHIAHCRDADGNGARFNLGGSCNVRVDKLTALAQLENDPGRRAAMISKAFRIIHEDTGFVPLHQQMLAWAMSDKIMRTTGPTIKSASR
jgi:peptide/nickel transport system substrate-binding protein